MWFVPPGCADRRTVETENEVPRPVTGHRPISDFRGALAEHDLGRNEGFSPAANSRSWHAECASGAQARGQLAAQRAPALHVKSLVNRLVTDTHRIIIGKVERQASGDLFRAPRHCPLPLLPGSSSASFPYHLRSRELYSGRRTDRTGKPLLHVPV